jgi:ribonuclease HII
MSLDLIPNVANLDEAGLGPICFRCYSSCVILDDEISDAFRNIVNDSKKLSEKKRDLARAIVIEEAREITVAWAETWEIDRLNILNANMLSFHRALDVIESNFPKILIDGNKFKPYNNIPHETIVKGDSKIYGIAAASIIAKTERDAYVKEMIEKYPDLKKYGIQTNMGYPTKEHKLAVKEYGMSMFHRRSFHLK